MIETTRLHLIIGEQRHLEALARHKDELGLLLQVAIPAGWPTFPEAFALPQGTVITPSEWDGYFFIDPTEQVLVGNGGFKGAPDETGTVEMGYEIAPEYWNRGYATEAVRGLIDYAFTHKPVNAVIAHTLAEKNASNRVLQKVGMTFIADVADAEFGTIWRWGVSRNAYENRGS